MRYADNIKALADVDKVTIATRMAADRRSWRAMVVGETSAVT